ncbi:hypothetical protein LTR85_011963 [Meristemomyces frigidus]|nr:hypothetical protein LTR85_011963 [Meristemomyces frigidus]
MSVSAEGPLPVLDFSAFRGEDSQARSTLLTNIKEACIDKGFFQLTNHGITKALEEQMMDASRQFFSLPISEKLKCDKSLNSYNRGYETIGAQILEPGSAPETKEAIYFGEDLPLDNPRVMRRSYNCGPNLYPEGLGQPFKNTVTEYYDSAKAVAQEVMRALALGLGLEEDWFDGLHDIGSELLLALGAHRDFGCITLLLQDDAGGLQVQDEVSGEWMDVTPVPGAIVVNLGNLMMRWTNHHYTSNMHRVMNYSGKDRYSIVYFFNGNPEHTLSIVPGCEERRDTKFKKFGPPVKAEKYDPILVRDFVSEQFVASYSRASIPEPASAKEIPALESSAAVPILGAA